MKRTMFQLYLKDCDAAMALYQRAFDAVVDCVYRHGETGVIEHAEMRAFGQCIAFSERASQTVPGNTMQFCFHFGEGGEPAVQKAYAVLQEGADIETPMGPCDWSPCMFGLVDRFGVCWCLFV